MNLDKVLNETEQRQIAIFNSNEIMKNAVEKVLLFAIYNQGTLMAGEPAGEDKNWAYGCDNGTGTDEEVGKRLRIKTTALSYLENAWKSLKAYQIENLEEEGEQIIEDNQAV